MRIKIFQINIRKDKNDMKFCSLGDKEIDSSIYQNVYFGDVQANNLEDIYKKFNCSRPATFKGHSLSVSDVVEIVDGENKLENGTYYCDRIGFKKINFDTSKCSEMEGIDVVYVTAGHSPLHIRIINELKDFQNAVGGSIETIFNHKDQTIIICNEEGVIKGMLPNRVLDNGIVVHGPFFICSTDNEDFTSLNQTEIDKYMKL